ncbi:hypothetical protein E4U09_002149 [Claviceps aff. purpurea]|uniref:Uncharacterized protein n=1 Tax=Claviceps aff. purpurea TaxID=1967640 RepID=A0A9P7U1C2_9HYPO|nr:hypothetical protein E4U09_002149 [Claviceps aff. purpurea]
MASIEQDPRAPAPHFISLVFTNAITWWTSVQALKQMPASEFVPCRINLATPARTTNGLVRTGINSWANSQACVDTPSAFFTIDLAEAYPEAKVVILNRDPKNAPNMKPTSAIRALRNLYLATMLPDFRQWTSLYCTPFDHATEKDKAIAWYNESHRRVREAIPADRRLEFSVKDGFRPTVRVPGCAGAHGPR